MRRFCLSQRETLRGGDFSSFNLFISPPQAEPLRKCGGGQCWPPLKEAYMPDYKQMYLIMIQASEEAINLLIKAQQECEELYLSAREPELTLLAPSRPPAL